MKVMLFRFILLISIGLIIYGVKKENKLSKYIGIAVIILAILSILIDNIIF
jgi:uncharacterized protein YqgC (DUF456 family)